MSNVEHSSIWILEDDEDCCFVYEQMLQGKYSIRFFNSIKSFDEEFSKADHQKILMIIADLTLPDGKFETFLSNGGAQRMDNIPFVIVSSNEDLDTLRLCLDEGAIDYITKPFNKNELIVKVEQVLKGHRGIKEKKREVFIDGNVITNLTAKQVKLMKLFLKSEDRVIDRDSILTQVWGPTSVHPKTIDVHLYNLRRKLHPFGYIIKSEGGGKWSLISDTF